MPPTTNRQVLRDMVEALTADRVDLVVEMVRALQRPVKAVVESNSDIVSQEFANDFSGRLVLFHAMHDAALTKKTFEYFFYGASKAAGRSAHLNSNSVHPGEDVTVDGIHFSLKTEGSKSIRADVIHISKLMEARWIRECRSGDDFCRLSHARILGHIAHYDRIISLRSFESQRHFDYELIEVPCDVLMRIKSLTPEDFSARTKSGSSSATVKTDTGQRIFVLSLDGAVEKVTVRNLDVKFCKLHARWRVGLI